MRRLFSNERIVSIAVNEDKYCDILEVAKGMKEDKANWFIFFQWLCGCGKGVSICQIPALYYSLLPQHISVVSRSKVNLVVKILKADHIQGSKKAAREKENATEA